MKLTDAEEQNWVVHDGNVAYKVFLRMTMLLDHNLDRTKTCYKLNEDFENFSKLLKLPDNFIDIPWMLKEIYSYLLYHKTTFNFSD